SYLPHPLSFPNDALPISDIFPIEAVQQRLMDCIGSEGFPRSRHRRQPGGKIHGIACNGVFLALATAGFARDHLAGGEPEMDLQRSEEHTSELKSLRYVVR